LPPTVKDAFIPGVKKNFLTRAIFFLACVVDAFFRALRFAGLKVIHRVGEFSSIPFPVVGDGKSDAQTGKGRHAHRKLDVILSHMPADVHRIVDIGSNNGFYAIGLAQRGYSVLGYEPVARFVSGANRILEWYGIQNVSFFQQGIDRENAGHLFASDVTLVLSVFHNWVRLDSWDGAIDILSGIWGNTRRAMFFELADTLDNRFIASFPTMPDMGGTTAECTAFIKEQILGRLEGARVEFIDMMPTDYINGSARHLFIVHRI